MHYLDREGAKVVGRGAQSECGFKMGCDYVTDLFGTCCEHLDCGHNDGVCRDGGPHTFAGHASTYVPNDNCPYSYDFHDCGRRTSLRPVLVEYACDDSCASAHDGQSDDRVAWQQPFGGNIGAPNSAAYKCAFGTGDVSRFVPGQFPRRSAAIVPEVFWLRVSPLRNGKNGSV